MQSLGQSHHRGPLKKLKCGDLGSDGRLFWCYQKKGDRVYETWMTPFAFKNAKDKQLHNHRTRSLSDNLYLEKRRKTSSSWKKQNKELVASCNSSRRCLIRNQKLDQNERKAVKDIYSFRNILNSVHGKVMFHVDHKIPLCFGGKHDSSNLMVVTAAFNLSKGARMN